MAEGAQPPSAIELVLEFLEAKKFDDSAAALRRARRDGDGARGVGAAPAAGTAGDEGDPPAELPLGGGSPVALSLPPAPACPASPGRAFSPEFGHGGQQLPVSISGMKRTGSEALDGYWASRCTFRWTQYCRSQRPKAS